MAVTLKDIQAPVASEMVAFEKKFRESMKTNVVLLDKIMSYIVKRKGKQMRPLFVFLSAGVSGNITDTTYNGAAMIELLHTATLVHDDVVDDSHYRRGFFSINALWKNKIAVLVGDFLFSKGFLVSLENDDFDLLKIISQTIKEMSEGELLQMEKARKLDITEEVYYDVIRQKTASLIAACCAIGASSAKSDGEVVARMREFGLNVGMAFQIKDDLFDYGTFEIGKPTGIDIKEKKMTLPLIHALKQVGKAERKKVINKMKKSAKQPKFVTEVIDFVKSHGGLEYAIEAMDRYHQKAQEILATFPDTQYRQSLEKLVQFTIERTK
ncbi:MAG: polyprenyl synthetase family protein [Cytophagales bacterium]|nr:polyprenyl synthetase family protein [Cytophagales bacterium]